MTSYRQSKKQTNTRLFKNGDLLLEVSDVKCAVGGGDSMLRGEPAWWRGAAVSAPSGKEVGEAPRRSPCAPHVALHVGTWTASLSPAWSAFRGQTLCIRSVFSEDV